MRGFFRLMMYTRPLRRISLQSLLRIFADLSEFFTFIFVLLLKKSNTNSDNLYNKNNDVSRIIFAVKTTLFLARCFAL